MKHPLILFFLFLAAFFPRGYGAEAPQDSPRARALILVDESVFPGIETELAAYIRCILEEHDILCTARPDRYYAMTPHRIRALLAAEHGKNGVPLVGAIMAGPIPHAPETPDPA